MPHLGCMLACASEMTRTELAIGGKGAIPPYFILTNTTSKLCCRAAWK